MAAFVSRLEHFPAVDSTQRVVRDWLDGGVAEVAIARADEQSLGRGRQGRTWQTPAGAGVLLSVGFRPAALAVRYGWRLAAIVALAMVDAAEDAAGLADGTLWLKWPNDIVAIGPGGMRKVAGVLGETAAAADRVESAVIGIGVNTDWPAADFPPSLASTMTSLRELSGGRPISNDILFEAFLDRLEPRYEAFRAGTFDAAGWSTRQVTTGREVVVEVGREHLRGTAIGVDPESGALLLGTADGAQRAIDSGEVTRCRLLADLV